MKKQTKRHRSLHFGRRHDLNLEICCRGIFFCKAGDNPKQPSSHRHCYRHLNGAKLRLSDLSNDDSRGTTAGCSLTLYPGYIYYVIYYIHTYIYTSVHPAQR